MEALTIFDEEKRECFAALVSIVETIYKRKEEIKADLLKKDLPKKPDSSKET